MEKRFKNSFGVKSDSVPLLEAFIKEVEALGWKHQTSSSNLSITKKLWFNGNVPTDYLNMGHYWVCSYFFNGLVVDLPSNWDKALALASEIIEEEVNPFKVGDWVTHKKTKTTYQITEIDEDNWCLGDVDGNGWKYTQLKKATKAQIAKKLATPVFKLGDTVVITSLTGQGDSKGDNFSGNIGHVGTITHISTSATGTVFYKLKPHCIGDCWPAYCLRYATHEDIAKMSKVIRFGGTDFIIEMGKDFARTDKGNVSKAEIQKVLGLFDAKISICGYDLKIKDVDNIRISFGCQTDTIGKAKEILAAFDE